MWIAQVGDATTFGTFAEFRRRLTGAAVTASDTVVTFASPTEGAMTFGWDAPFTVAGNAIDLHPPFRMQNRYATVPFQGRHYAIRAGSEALVLDFDTWTRSTTP